MTDTTVSEQLTDSVLVYLDFVIEKISGLKEQDEKQEYMRKHRITTRIVNTGGKSYFSIFRKDKLVDQNDLRIFAKREKKVEISSVTTTEND